MFGGRASYKCPADNLENCATIGPMSSEARNESTERPEPRKLRFSLRDLFCLITIAGLFVAFWSTYWRLAKSQSELALLRAESGYLSPTPGNQIAAVRVPVDQPLTYQLRIRVPSKGRFRVAYSSIWKKSEAAPDWYSAMALPSGESILIVRIMEDPRDGRWKIATLVHSTLGTKRMATVLPDDHTSVFRGSHQVISSSVGRQMVAVAKSDSIRLLEEKWQVGEGGLMLYGDSAPERDQIGVFAELQPDSGSL